MYHFFNYKNVQIRYTSSGKGKAIVLLHGFLENLDMWNAIVPKLAKNSRVIAIDLFGHGATGNLGYIHTMEDQALLVKALLNHLRLRKYILIGHSMGGYISLAFAELFPDNLKGLCLMNSSALADSNEKKCNRDRAIIAVKQHRETFIKIAIPNLFSEDNKPIYKTEIRQITEEALEISTQGIVASLEGMKIRKDQSKILAKGSFQKMLIFGKKDPILDYRSIINQTKDTNVTVIEFPDGHMSHIENKDELICTLQNFTAT